MRPSGSIRQRSTDSFEISYSLGLDPLSAAERDRLESEHMQSMLEVARLHAALDLDADPMASFIPPESASEAQIALQKTLLISQVCSIKHRWKWTTAL